MRTTRARERQRARRRFFVILFIILLSLAVLMGWYLRPKSGFTMDSLRPSMWVTQVKELFHRSSNVSTMPKPAEREVVTQEAPEVHFDFYTELPKMQVKSQATQDEPPKSPVVSNAPKGISAASSPLVKSSATESEVSVKENNLAPHYVVQLGAYKSERTASEMRISILLAGFDANIAKSTLDGQVVYRVQQGPYYSLSRAKSAAKKLEAKGFDSSVQKID